MSRRISLSIALVLIAGLLGQDAAASVGDPIDNVEQRVSERGYRFGAEQISPDIATRYLVWQDHRGDSDTPNGKRIWSKDLSTRGEAPVSSFATEHANPRISGRWVVWTDSRNGNDDIFARKLPDGKTLRVTNNVAHQMNPVIDGTIVAWEDYRNGTADIFKRDIAVKIKKKHRKLKRKKYKLGPETQVVTGPGDQTSPSISGGTVAWRDGRRGSTVADVYARTGSGPETEVARAIGSAASLSPHNVAVSGSRVLWNEADPAECGSDCSPKILKTCTLPCAGEETVDAIAPADPDGSSVADVDLSEDRATWSKQNGPSHIFTVDLSTCDAPPCEAPTQVDTVTGDGAIANSSRVQGQRFAWTQGTQGSSDLDVFWRDLPPSDPPMRANSLSLGPFGTHLSPAADGDNVVYRAPGEEGTFLDHPGKPPLFRTWATDLGVPRHFAVSTVLGTDTSRPAIVGDRAVWSDLRNCTTFATCPENSDDIFERDPLDSGAEDQLSDPDRTGGHGDADGANTAWRCRAPLASDPPTSICLHDGSTTSVFDLSTFLLDPSSAVGNLVRISGDLVAWYEFFDGAPDARLHVLNTSNGDDEIIGTGPEVVGDVPDFDISGFEVVWAGQTVPEESKVWRATVTGTCGVDPSPCDHTGLATAFEEPVANHILSSVAIGGTRTAWVDCPEQFATVCDVYTRTLTEPDSHLVTNESSGNASNPHIDDDRIYWVDERSGTPDIFMESISGAALPAPDTTSPAPPTSFTAGANTGAVALAWNNPADADFFRVRILRRESKSPPASLDDTRATVVYEDDGTSFTDTDVVAGRRYSYRIFAFDLDANFSTPATATSG